QPDRENKVSPILPTVGSRGRGRGIELLSCHVTAPDKNAVKPARIAGCDRWPKPTPLFMKLQCRQVVLRRAMELRNYILCGRPSRTRDVLRLAPDDVARRAGSQPSEERRQAIVAAGESSGGRSANADYRLGPNSRRNEKGGSRRPALRQKPLPPCRSMNAHRLQIVLAHGGESEVAAGQHGDLGAVGGMDGEARLVIDGDAPDIGEVLHAEEREFLGRDLPQLLVDLIHGLFLSPAVARVAPSAATRLATIL